MHILITNDDGYSARGIEILTQELSQVADVSVVAPERDKSGASNSLTLKRPLRVKCLQQGRYFVDGTPTDCVHLALSGLLESQPDMVVSGINAGPNLGDDVLYSGTVAGCDGRALPRFARDRRFTGRQSCHPFRNCSCDYAARYRTPGATSAA